MAKHDGTLYYYGASNTWEITKEQWKSVGVNDQGTVVFERKDRGKYNRSDLSDAALEFLVKHHAGEFEFMGKSSLDGTSDEKSSAPVAEGETKSGAPAPNGE